jgi:hypothetical protein
VGLTHAARGNAVGGARLLRRGAGALGDWETERGEDRPYGIDLAGVARWARELAGRVESGDGDGPVDAADEAPRLRS